MKKQKNRLLGLFALRHLAERDWNRARQSLAERAATKKIEEEIEIINDEIDLIFLTRNLQ